MSDEIERKRKKFDENGFKYLLKDLTKINTDEKNQDFYYDPEAKSATQVLEHVGAKHALNILQNSKKWKLDDYLSQFVEKGFMNFVQKGLLTKFNLYNKETPARDVSVSMLDEKDKKQKPTL